jgi:hypothetical protein
MPTLDWIGKKAVHHHHQEIAHHLLSDTSELKDNGIHLCESLASR